VSGPQMRSPAPRGNAEVRAESSRKNASRSISGAEPEANFAAIYVSRRFGLALPIARTIAALASIGGAFG
jgi:hypothetical protein